MKNINNKARWFFRSFLKMFTFTAVLFVFQACYGMPTDADSLKSNLDTEDNIDSSAGINQDLLEETTLPEETIASEE